MARSRSLNQLLSRAVSHYLNQPHSQQEIEHALRQRFELPAPAECPCGCGLKDRICEEQKKRVDEIAEEIPF